MAEKILHENPVEVFVILAETLEKWQDPHSEAGRAVLLEHYSWGAALRANGKLILAGPVDVDLTSTGKIDPVGHTTGLIMLNVASREEAMEWAEKDPFHIHGYRKNVVHSLKITMMENPVFETIQHIKNQA